MNKNDLKKALKSIVKECLTEILAEEYIKNTVKKAINENLNSSSLSLLPENFNKKADNKKEVQQLKEKKEFEDLNQKRRELLGRVLINENSNKQKVDDNPYADIFADTMKSGHPLITGEDNGVSNPMQSPTKEIPEKVLDKLGLMDKDWSQYIK